MNWVKTEFYGGYNQVSSCLSLSHGLIKNHNTGSAILILEVYLSKPFDNVF